MNLILRKLEKVTFVARAGDGGGGAYAMIPTEHRVRVRRTA
jgi:hypothetical protein